MSKSVLFKLSAVILILGSLTLSYAHFFPGPYPNNVEDVEKFLSYIAVSTPIFILATLLVLFGFIGLYAKHHSRIGWAGLVGFVFLFSFITLYNFTAYTLDYSLGNALLEGVTTEAGYKEAETILEAAFGYSVFNYFVTILIPLVLIGALTFGISIIRSNATAKWPAYILLLAILTLFVGFTGLEFLSFLDNAGVFFLSLAAFGLTLFTEENKRE